MTAPQYEVIIVGGRPAGSSLALRLGRAGLRVLLIEKARLAEQSPLSVPFLMNSAMQLLDELDLAEADYAGDAPRLRRFYLHFRDSFRTHLHIADVAGRDYVYVVDRVRFDCALWHKLASQPTVDCQQSSQLVDLLRDTGGQVCGITYRDAGGQLRTAHAPWVVGADGRYSLVARKAQARITLSHPEVATSALYAFWSGVRPYEPRDGEPHAVQIYSSCDGFSTIAMPTTAGRVGIVLQGCADRFLPKTGHIEDYYLAGLRKMPAVWDRLGKAQRVSPMFGCKRIGNLYRQAGGPGWLLCGDAYHQKDFIDAQGIYDALLESKLLAGCLIDWHSGKLAAADVVSRYDREAFAATHPMFQATVDRLKRELFTTLPPLVIKTVLRTLMTSPAYMQRFAKLVSRQIEPKDFAPKTFLLTTLLKNLPHVLLGKEGG